jgi:hypothetical protein
MSTPTQQAPRRLRRRIWVSVVVTLVLVLLAGGAFAVGREDSPEVTAIGCTKIATATSVPPGTSLLRGHGDDVTWMRAHMAGLTWLRNHERLWRRTSHDPGPWWSMPDRMRYLPWIRGHPDQRRWARMHPRSWMSEHLRDMMSRR